MPIDPFDTVKASFEALDEDSQIEALKKELPYFTPTLYNYYKKLNTQQQIIFNHYFLLQKDRNRVSKELGLERLVVEEEVEKLLFFSFYNFDTIISEGIRRLEERNRQYPSLSDRINEKKLDINARKTYVSN